jgi:hypothetical protein
MLRTFLTLERAKVALCRVTIAIAITGSACWAQGTPGFTTTPASPVELGPSAVGMTTPHGGPVPLQINNPGTAPLVVSGFNFPTGIMFTSETQFLFPVTIPPGSSFTPALLFTPQVAGRQTVQATTIDNATGNPHIVEFTGTGVVVPANDFLMIIDPGTASPVSVTTGGSTSFPIWLLAGTGLGPTSINSIQCSGGPVATSCTLSPVFTALALVGDSFGPTREELMVTLTVPPKSAAQRHTSVWWGMAGSAVFLLLGWTRRNPAPFIAILIVGAFLISCGGGSKPVAMPGLPAGSNSLVITATPTTGVAHTLTVPLTIQ